jgi:hypothetical protein
MNEITKLAVDFLNAHWDEINLEKCGIDDYSKEKLLKEVKKNYYDACWVVSEVMNWGCEKSYLAEYIIECEEWLVIKIGDKYWKYDSDGFVNAIPKTKTVLYFE